jgi:putative Mg2+ transporter-C (MgtC) family protein
MHPFGALPAGIAVLRLLVAAVCGAILASERGAVGRAAGPRTYILVAMSACLYTLVGQSLGSVSFGPDAKIQVDPTRLTQSVTAGVAFLAAGAVFMMRGHVHNLTTGAAMWLSGAIGLACGAGQIALALVATVLVVLVMVPVRRIEKRIMPETDDSAGTPPDEPPKT